MVMTQRLECFHESLTGDTKNNMPVSHLHETKFSLYTMAKPKRPQDGIVVVRDNFETFANFQVLSSCYSYQAGSLSWHRMFGTLK